jgi:hypothetical protein
MAHLRIDCTRTEVQKLWTYLVLYLCSHLFRCRITVGSVLFPDLLVDLKVRRDIIPQAEIPERSPLRIPGAVNLLKR